MANKLVKLIVFALGHIPFYRKYSARYQQQQIEQMEAKKDLRDKLADIVSKGGNNQEAIDCLVQTIDDTCKIAGNELLSEPMKHAQIMIRLKKGSVFLDNYS